MIMGSLDGIATETAHDHEVARAGGTRGASRTGLFLELLMSLRPK